MPNEIPKHLRPTVTVTPTMREAARRAGIDVSRDDAVLRWRHERVCRLRALRKMCRKIVAARAHKPLAETPVDVGDGETRDEDEDVDHNEDTPRRTHPWDASEARFNVDELPDLVTVKRREVM